MAGRNGALCARPNRLVDRRGDGRPVSDQKDLVVLCADSQTERTAVMSHEQTVLTANRFD